MDYIMKVGDLVKATDVVACRGKVGLVIEICQGDVLVKWADGGGYGRGRWHRKSFLRRLK